MNTKQKKISGNTLRIIIFIFLLVAIIIIGICLKDSLLSILTAFTLIGYILPLIYAKKLGLYIGVAYSVIYLIYAWLIPIYSTCVYELFFALPCLIISIIHWQVEKEEVYYKMPKILILIFWVIFISFTTLVCIINKCTNDRYPFFDAIELIDNALGLFLLIFKFRLYWWTNFISLFVGSWMFILQYINQHEGLTLAICELLLLLIGIIALFRFYCSNSKCVREFDKNIFKFKKKNNLNSK